MPEPVKITLADGTNFEFTNGGMVREWIGKELVIWTAFRSIFDTGMYDQLRNLHGYDMDLVFSQPSYRQGFVELATSVLNKHWHSGHAKMRFVLECFDKEKERSAGRYCALHNCAPHANLSIPAGYYLGVSDVAMTYGSPNETTKAAMMSAVEEVDRLRQLRERAAKEIELLRANSLQDHSELVSRFQGERTKLEQDGKKLLETIDREATRRVLEFHQQGDQERVNFTDTCKAAQSELESLKATYTGFMKLAPSANYWKDKARGHMAAFAGAAGVLIAFVLYSVYLGQRAYYEFLHDLPEGESPALWVLLSLGFLVTLGFWFLRLLAKIVFSQFHLMLDAKERRMFITTYLALIKEGQMNEKELAIVLAAIFRPATDGMVKEESPSYPSTEMLLALLGKARQ